MDDNDDDAAARESGLRKYMLENPVSENTEPGLKTYSPTLACSVPDRHNQG